MNTLGERVKLLRNMKKLKQIDVAKEINVSTSNISRIEKNEISPSADIILQICKFFNVSSDWLLTGKGDPRPTTNEPTLTPNPAPQLSLSETEEIILQAYRCANKKGRFLIAKSVLQISNQEPENTQQPIQDDERIATGTTIDSTTNVESAENEDDLWIEKEVEAYKQALQLKANLKMSSAS